MSMGFRIVVSDDGHVEIQTDVGIQRPEKGQSILAAVDSFVAVDLETTGLSPMFDDIIELAAVRYSGGNTVGAFSQLVDPDCEIDGFITELTGITNEMLHGQPTIDEALPRFLDFVGDSVIVGHNVNFDVNFLYDSCTDLELPPFRNDFIDTMRMARRLYKELPDHRLDTVLAALELPARDLHRAENDADLTAKAYLRMLQEPDFDYAMRSNPWTVKAKDITAREGFTNENSPLFGRVCVFTGALENFTRKEAMQIVADIGGIPNDSMTKKTNFLILGNNDYCKSIKDGKSSKQKKAEKMILDGADLQIIPESVFIDMVTAE